MKAIMKPVAPLAVAAMALLLAACDAGSNANADDRPNFRAALDVHLATISARDLAAFKETLTNGDDLIVIFPNGHALESTQAVIDFHQEWFGDDQWRFEPDVINIVEGKDMATALLKYQYRDTPDGAPRSNWLVLVFKLEGGAWRLVHDQNTRIDPPAENDG